MPILWLSLLFAGPLDRAPEGGTAAQPVLVVLDPAAVALPPTQHNSRTEGDRNIIGTDGRQQQTPTTSFPWTAVVKVRTTFNFGVTWHDYSGVMIRPGCVLTAGQAVYDRELGFNRLVTAMEVRPALDDATEPYGHQHASVVSYFLGWSVNADTQYDVGVVKLDSTPGTGNFGWGIPTDSGLENNTLRTAGYPLDKGGAQMWRSYESAIVSPPDYSPPNLIHHQCDTDATQGQRGSPLYWFTEGSYYVVGVNSVYNATLGANQGVRLRDPFLPWIYATCGECTNDCDYGTQECLSAATYRECRFDLDSDYCAEWTTAPLSCNVDQHCAVDGCYMNLCKPCTTSDDCEPGALCIYFPPAGQDFCGQDCSVNSCPTGYSCEDLGGGVFQCAPLDGDICSLCTPQCCPVCAGAECGADGCGGSCGSCGGSTPYCNAGVCVQCTLDAQCSDGAWCTGQESCSLIGFSCQSGSAPNCNDGVSCTVDSCDESNDVCLHPPDNALCSDGLYCSGSETCDPIQGCRPGVAPNCNDGVDCTVDSCDENNDVCLHPPSNPLCDDGLYCSGSETCNATLGCQTQLRSCDDGVLCTADSCNEVNDRCDHPLNHALCDDGLYCTGAESCDALLGCQSGASPSCNDGLSCTLDSCDETDDRCVHTADQAACDDDNSCTDDSCSLGAGCQYTSNTQPCDDNVACTVGDLCSGGSCAPGALRDGDTDGFADAACGGTDCNDADDGVHPGAAEGPFGGPSCADTVDNDCDGTTDGDDTSCRQCAGDAECDDGNLCNGLESCSEGSCQPGTLLACSDENPCTSDTCDPRQGCVFAPNTAACSDGLACTTGDGCQDGACRGTPDHSRCNDGDNCTTDSCDPVNGCTSTPSAPDHDDDGYPDQACGGTDCDDANDQVNPGEFEGGISTAAECTDSLDNNCNGLTDKEEAACNQCSDNVFCDDGNKCNGDETCVAGVCTPGSLDCEDQDPCTLDRCDPATGCVHTGTCEDGGTDGGADGADDGADSGTDDAEGGGDGIQVTVSSCGCTSSAIPVQPTDPCILLLVLLPLGILRRR